MQCCIVKWLAPVACLLACSFAGVALVNDPTVAGAPGACLEAVPLLFINPSICVVALGQILRVSQCLCESCACPSARFAARFAGCLLNNSLSDGVDSVTFRLCCRFACASLPYFIRHPYRFHATRCFASFGGLGIVATRAGFDWTGHSACGKLPHRPVVGDVNNQTSRLQYTGASKSVWKLLNQPPQTPFVMQSQDVGLAQSLAGWVGAATKVGASLTHWIWCLLALCPPLYNSNSSPFDS